MTWGIDRVDVSRKLVYTGYFVHNDEGTNPYVVQFDVPVDSRTSDEAAFEATKKNAQQAIYQALEKLWNEKGEHGLDYEFACWTVRNGDGRELKHSDVLTITIPGKRTKAIDAPKIDSAVV